MPEPTHETDATNSPPNTPTDPATLVTVHGVVRNAVTGEPLPRALVQIGGESGQAALTDDNGRFEIGGVPPGPNIFQLTRPGFRDTIPGMERSTVTPTGPAEPHGVFVTAAMPELDFAMKPTNVIRGQVELSTGDPAQNIRLDLLHRAVQDGRASWRIVANTHTNADGAYRFANLEDGEYIIYSEPAMESDLPVALVQPADDATFARSGFPLTFYPDARDFSTAARIQVRGGNTAQANIHLSLEPFHLVRVEVKPAGPPPSQPGVNAAFTAAVNDTQSHPLPYNALYDDATHTVQAVLPDGAYSLRISYARAMLMRTANAGPNSSSIPAVASGQVDFTVAGRNLTHLRADVVRQAPGSMQINLARTSASGTASHTPQAVYVMISQAGSGVSDGMVAQFAQGNLPGPLETQPSDPGSYWVHVTPSSGYCLQSFTAGGADLAREPLVLNPSGATAPLTLRLRDDCSSLHLVMPPNLPRLPTGEEPSLTVYIVPDSDLPTDVVPVTLRPSTGGEFTVQNLTPGSYHVYAFPAPAALEYHNRDALSSLPSQQVTLEPSGTATFVLEAPAQ